MVSPTGLTLLNSSCQGISGPHGPSRDQLGDFLLDKSHEFGPVLETFDFSPRDDDELDLLGQRQRHLMVCTVAVFGVPGNALGCDQDAEIEAPVPKLCNEGDDLRAAHRRGPVLALDPEERL
jgi:hypothetical protein